MEAFLQECKDNLERLERFSTVKVVMGNESCDLDSAVSALTYALLLREALGPAGGSQPQRCAVLPVLNIPQADLPLKTEVMFYFAENDVPLDLLIFRDQIDLRALTEANKLQLILVDFHVLTPQDEFLKPAVVEVIDHRPQERGWEWEERRVTLEIVGSCSTLITRKILESAPGLLTSQVALLLLGPLLLDTVCLSPSAGRATPADHHVARELEKVLPGIARDEVFHLLHHARSNTQGLTAAQLLIKDLKVVAGHTPMPAMQLLLQEYLERANALAALEELCESGKYEQAVLMGMHVDEDTKDVRRELAVFSRSSDTADQLAALLERSTEPNLELAALDLPNNLAPGRGKLILYKQNNVKASRKQVLPIVRSFKTEKILPPPRRGINNQEISLKKSAPKPPNGIHRNIISNLTVDQEDDQDSPWYDQLPPDMPPPSLPPPDLLPPALPYGASNLLDEPCSLTAGGLGMEMGSQQEYLMSFNLVCALLEQEKLKREVYSENGEAETPSDEKMDISDASSGSPSQLAGLELGAELVHGATDTMAAMLDNRPTPQPRTKLATAPTTSDTDNSERLVSLSSALASLKLPELAEQRLADEPVDFPSSPNQMKLLTQKSLQAQGLPLTEEEECEGPMDEDDEDPSTYQAVLSPDCTDVRLLKEKEDSSNLSAKKQEAAPAGENGEGRSERSYSMASTVECGEGLSLLPEGTPTGDLEEYYEDVPMPEGQQYTTVMSRQESFRRRMKGMKVEDAAEFARIGRVVASGELSKHDSIRRKLVGHNTRPALFPTHFEEGDPRALWARSGDSKRLAEDPANSDPIASYDPMVEDASLMLMLDKARLPDSQVDHMMLADTPSLNPTSFVDESTISRVKACFDSESFKDLYTLAGRLQDLLSPQEVEEIIRNRGVYSTILDQRIVSALELAVEEPQSIKPQAAATSQAKGSSPTAAPQDEDEEEEGGFMFVRHDSKRLNEADADRVIEGLFVESRQSNQSTPNSQRRKLLPLAPDILSQEPQSPDEPNKTFNAPESGEEKSSASPHHARLSRSTDKPLPPNCLVLDPASLPRTPQPLSRQLAAAPAEKQHRKKRIAVSADILNGPADDSDSDVPTELPDSKAVSAPRGHGSEEDDLDVSDILSLDTPDEMEESILERLSQQQPVAPLPELSAAEERAEERNWKSCVVAGLERQIDMKVIAPYKRVLHHGGYLGGGAQNAIIVFTACYLPDRSRIDYDYVMDNLFLYVLTTLDQLVAEDYVLVYLHGATARSCMPTFSWLKRCYHMIDRRLRKNLKGLYLVHPTFWLKTIVVMTRPFVSTKFSRKLSFVETLTDLAQLVPLEQITIPERVKQYDLIKQSIQQANSRD